MGLSVVLPPLLALVGLFGQSPAPENHVVNGDMERVTAAGVPDVWQSAGDSKYVTQELSADAGREGGHSLRLDCTAFEQVNPACHAMVCQVGQVGVEHGKWYSVSLWARGEGLDETPVSIALSDMRQWQSLGLAGGFVAGPDWERHEFLFQATGDGHDATRFQIWFLGTGTLWLDDVSFTETTVKAAPTLVWPAAGHRNLVGNSGFEVGTDGWGSIGDFPSRGWPLPLNKLFGEVVLEGAHEGARCLRMDTTPETLPVSFFDYFTMTRQPAKALLAGSIGWMETIPGAPHCFSVWLRASGDDQPARLQVQPFGAAPVTREVHVGQEWRRYDMTLRPVSGWCWVAAGPVLGGEADLPVTVWMDAVQFEAGEQPTDFEAREPAEVGIETQREGNVFGVGEPVRLDLFARNAAAEAATVELLVTDYWDQPVARQTYDVPGGTALWQRTVDAGIERKGFFRVHLSVNGREQPRSLRLAVIPRYGGNDSIFGVNHAYPWPHLLRECVDAGLLWVRDWSVKWQDVQPTPDAPFDFTETDRQIDRPLSFGQSVLALLPFPSTNWSSGAPPDIAVGTGYPAIRQRQAYAPRDDAEFGRWVAETVAHYRGRVTWYQVFNEPIYTDYSLPRAHGYTGKDYGRLVKVFAEAARRADPNCRILAGIGAWPSATDPVFRDMFAEGALAAIDAVDVHVYPGLTPPEAIEKGLPTLRDLMARNGGVKPIWLTEHGYYSDDDFEQAPIRDSGFNVPLPSERVQAEYSMRFNVMLLAHGAERIFYHAGTCPGLNEDNTEGIFFEYGGAPRRIYAAVAAFADLFRPGTEPLGEWDWGKQAKAYLFRADDRLVLAMWARSTAGRKTLRWTDERIVARDMMGNDLAERSVTLSSAPVFLVARELAPDGLREALRAAE